MLTQFHRLVVPADANHHGTLYAGSLLRLALEAAYAAAYRQAGLGANLVLRRVLSVECHHPVPVGTVLEIVGGALYATPAYLVIGLLGTPLGEGQGPWMEGLMGFVQVTDHGRATPFPTPLKLDDPPADPVWDRLRDRLGKLLAVR